MNECFSVINYPIKLVLFVSFKSSLIDFDDVLLGDIVVIPKKIWSFEVDVFFSYVGEVLLW